MTREYACRSRAAAYVTQACSRLHIVRHASSHGRQFFGYRVLRQPEKTLSSAHLQHYYLLASLTMACSATAPFTRKYDVGKPPKGEVHSNCKASSLFPSIAAACNTSRGDESQVQQQYIVGVLGMHTLSAKLVNRAKYRCILYQPSLPVTPCLGLPW